MTTYTLAVVGKETYTISTEGPINKITFNERDVTVAVFKETFFSQNNLLCIERTCLTKFEETSDFTSCPQYVATTTINDSPIFDLYDCLLQCASSDLNSAPITYTSKIELKKDVNAIEYLSDLRIISGLRWSDVVNDIIIGNKFVVTAVFTNPNCHVKNVALEFTYSIIEDT
jgi:hypothetical protein